ncbi:C39 family peptidase [Dactylosporangium sp. NPDC050688]|uniref:C39 family peptidase n=1 Tax=Dactylosporangium sp. NPDC050688 TaxID=3157217 RepID=UPI0033E98B88
MSYLYKPRHHSPSPSPVPLRSRVLPIAVAAAVLAVTLVVGVAVQASGPGLLADAQSLTSADSSRSDVGQAARDRQRTQAAPDAAAAPSKAAAGAAPSTPAPPAATSTAPPAATAGTTAPAAPAAKELAYRFAWQENFYFCGPAATRIALTARSMYPSQSEVAQSLRTTVNGTDSADDTTRTLNAYTKSSFYKSHYITGQSATQAEIDRMQADIVNAIANGYAVVANITGSAVDDKGGSHAYPGGHYIAVVGYSNGGKTVKIADPADALGVGHYTLTTAKLAHWTALRGYSA